MVGRKSEPTEKVRVRSFPISERSRAANIAEVGNKGKVGVQRGRETVGVPSFLPPRRAGATLPRSAERETPAVRRRRNSPPGKDVPLRGSSTPLSGCRKWAAAQKGRSAHALRVPRRACAAEWVHHLSPRKFLEKISENLLTNTPIPRYNIQADCDKTSLQRVPAFYIPQ